MTSTDKPESGPRADRTREEDKGRPARFRVFVRKWKDPVVAALLIPTAIVTVVLAFEMRGYSKQRADDARAVRVIAQQQQQSVRETARAAKLSCQRSREYGPRLADFYEREGVLPLSVIEEYRKTIPVECPK